ncbi:MAG: response regulator [Desulfobacterales bacterium]|nr:response regulator [Desulfobacterales bacterium]
MAIVMIVDDSWLTRRVLANILKLDGYQIIEANGGIQALSLIQQTPPDCMLLDLLMPDMDGYETLKLIKDKGYHFPVIILTADIQDTAKEKCFQLGAADYINKPADEKTIRSLVHRFINS